MIIMGKRTTMCAAALLTMAAVVCSILPTLASAATEPECIRMGDDLLAAKGENESQVLNISRRIFLECDPLKLDVLSQHFHEIGQNSHALAVADGCVKTHPQESLCWRRKGLQHLYIRQLNEAEDAWKRALALEEGNASGQQKVRELLEIVRKAKRMRDIMGW